jgi:hypothetical protein
MKNGALIDSPQILGYELIRLYNKPENYRYPYPDAIQFGFNPSKDALFLEPGQDNPFVNVLAVREDNKHEAAIPALSDALSSDEVKKFIEEKYSGSVVFVGQKFE